MNEHIYSLMRKAGYQAPPIEQQAQRLAELIIRDCAKIADVAEPYHSQDLILQYFGIQHEPQHRN